MKYRAAAGSLVPWRRNAQDIALTTMSSRSATSSRQISRVRYVELWTGGRPFNAKVLTSAARRCQRSGDLAQAFILTSPIRPAAQAGPEIKQPKQSTSFQLAIPLPSPSTSDQVMPAIAAG